MLISKAGKGIYSHVGIASWHYDILECVEFREFKGGRTVSLDRYMEIVGPNVIDVFRPVPEYALQIPSVIDNNLIINHEQFKYLGIKTTRYMRALTGLPYGWKRIWLMAKRNFIFLRWFIRPNVDDDSDGDIYPVCSTAIAKAFRYTYIDLVPYKADCYVEPSDLSRSPLLNYLFTIGQP